MKVPPLDLESTFESRLRILSEVGHLPRLAGQASLRFGRKSISRETRVNSLRTKISNVIVFFKIQGDLVLFSVCFFLFSRSF